VESSRSGAPPVVLVFGLDDRAVRWTTLQLRGAGVAAVSIAADLPTRVAASVCAAADAGIHLVSARHGMDGTFLEYWQMLAESGRARIAAVYALAPDTLDVNESAAIAARVLEEDVLPVTLPLLDDDESVIGVLDVITGEQELATGEVQPPRDDFTEAVEMETNALYDEVESLGLGPLEALHAGDIAVAATLDVGTGAGVGWLAGHQPPRGVPAATTVLGSDGGEAVLVTAGPDGLAVGTAVSVLGSRSQSVRISALAGLLDNSLASHIGPGLTAAATIHPSPAQGAWLVDVD
jgi:hypothetical protein